MPELVPTWWRLGKLADGDELTLRMLSLYDPPSLVSGCSQAVLRFERASPVLVRNYDFDPARFERVIYASALTGRRVIGTSAGLWGLLDGVNEDGLALSVAFGGRMAVGKGFGIQLTARYVLETCATVASARRVLDRLPIQTAHNVTLLDRGEAAVTLHVGPDREPTETHYLVATNHQDPDAWPAHTAWTRSVERERCLLQLTKEHADCAQVVDALLRPPLRATDYEGGMGTLYTAVYDPGRATVQYHWPGASWAQSVARFRPGTHTVKLP